MMMWGIVVILSLLLTLLSADAAGVSLGKKIRIGYFGKTNNVWKQSIINAPDDRHSVASITKHFFDIIVLSVDSPPPNDVHIDLFVWDDYPTFDNWVQTLPERPAALQMYNGGPLVQQLESKKVWKDWMLQVGMQDAIGKVYTLQNASYPCVFKYAKVEFGMGVKIARNSSHLKQLISEAGGQPYVIEEALSGLGMTELGAYGGAFGGQLTSLRCKKQYFDTVDVKKVDETTVHKGVFVSGHKLQESSSTLIACGKDIVSQVSAMLRLANYTGAFCVDIKFDGQKKAKFLEINPRMCETMMHRAALFLATYLPLAFATRSFANRFPEYKALNDHKSWYSRDEFHLSYFREQHLLATGGSPEAPGEAAHDHFDGNREYAGRIFQH